MSQPMSHLPFAASVSMSNPWPTRHQSKVEEACHTAPANDELPLLDELVRLSHGDTGWILLIAPPGLPVAKQLQAQGINPARVLVVHSPKIKNWQRMLEQSLGNGHCAAVLTWLPAQVSLDRVKLSKLGQRFGVLTRFFEPAGKLLPVHSGPLAYGGQDVYLNH
ncbi:cell division inhibitor [Aeromonas salmonicida]|uniref:cell division inhibitor SulA n=1 Tax=Aeromonas salmonicida TaxID=645 RepID=UPI00259E0B89|nr:cell division inhibitor [Aeromonas salmonicida]MDM5064869.1 cell division inhibitor [Aeromonas salmonicida]